MRLNHRVGCCLDIVVELVQVPDRDRGSLGRVNMEGYLARVRRRWVDGDARLLGGRGRIGAEYHMRRYPSFSLAPRPNSG